MEPEPALVITGVGVVSPFGVGIGPFTDGIRRGKSAIRQLDPAKWNLSSSCTAGSVPDFRPEEFDGDYRFLRLPRITQFSVIATDLALRDALFDPQRTSGEAVGVFSGMMHGVMDQTEHYYSTIFDKGAKFANPLLFQSTVPNATVSEISLRFGFKGMALTITSGAPSSFLALKMASIALRARRIRTAVILGAEELSSRTLGTYRLLRRLSPTRGGEELSCPFDAKRNGMILSEGAVAMIVEAEQEAEARGVTPKAAILGVGAAHDACGTAGRDGGGLEGAMREALAAAHIPFTSVDYIAATGNSSRVLDEVESAAIRRVAGASLRPHVRVSSIKSMLGESFSAGALLGVAACIAAIRNGFLPPTVNYVNPDPLCELSHVLQPEDAAPEIAIANSACFGGNSAAVVLAGTHSAPMKGNR